MSNLSPIYWPQAVSFRCIFNRPQKDDWQNKKSVEYSKIKSIGCLPVTKTQWFAKST